MNRILTAQKLNIILISTCLLIDISFIAYCFSLNYFKATHTHGAYYSRINSLKSIDPLIPRDLPYEEFNEQKQHRQLERALKNGDVGQVYGTSSNFLGIVGTGMYATVCDTCILDGMPHHFNPSIPLFCITLRGWMLNSTTSSMPETDSVTFHVENGQAYVRKGIVKGETTDITGRKTYKVEMKDVPVKFWYSHRLQMLKIQVSEKVKNIVSTVIKISIVILGLYALFLISIFTDLLFSLYKASTANRTGLIVILGAIFYFTGILLLLARRLVRPFFKTEDSEEEIFSRRNVIYLQILAYSLTCFPIFLFLLNLSMALIFNSYFTSDVILNTERLKPWFITMHIGFAFILVLNAFIHGKVLKDEQALTV